MIHLSINKTDICVDESCTILDAATQLGIEIPTMCFVKDLNPSVSCMLCIMEDKKTGKIFPSCASLVQEGMQIETHNPEIISLRKSALELLLSDHLGDCEAPCQRACPSHINIPFMNRFAAKNNLKSASKVIENSNILANYSCDTCNAPCEKVCRRKSIDQAVSIKLIRQFVEKNGQLSYKNSVNFEIKNSDKKFNSSYGKIRENEKQEFLKDAQNTNNRIEPQNINAGLNIDETISEALRCMHCDCRKLDTCKLKIQSENHDAKQRTYLLSERKSVTKIIHPNSIVYEPQKCIKCGICMQISGKYSDAAGFTFIGRGFDVKMGFPFDKSIENSIQNAAAECAEKCPTGAIAFVKSND